MEFIDLDDLNNKENPNSIFKIKTDSKILDGKLTSDEVDGICADYNIIHINEKEKQTENDVDQICVKDCDVSNYYLDNNCSQNSFLIKNLFSELVSEFQRSIARTNLGIADAYNLLWGNISGNLANQKDLYNFITDTSASNLNELIEEINTKLAQWACEISNNLNNKANINSPEFTGEPKVPLPLLSDESKRIASTEWVKSLITSLQPSQNIKFLEVTPNDLFYGEPSVDIRVTWDYNDSSKVISQKLNGITIPNNIRSYIFTNIIDSIVFELECVTTEKTEYKLTSLNFYYPIYYGNQSIILNLTKTKNNKFKIVTSTNQYMYILIPRYKNSRIAVNNFIGGFNDPQILNLNGIDYLFYKSVNPNLGTCYIEIIDD